MGLVSRVEGRRIGDALATLWRRIGDALKGIADDDSYRQRRDGSYRAYAARHKTIRHFARFFCSFFCY